MTHEDTATIISRNTYRSTKSRPSRMIIAIKLLFLWTGCIIAIEAVVCVLTYMAYMERGQAGIGGEWILIFAFAYGIVYFTDKLANNIKNPPKTRQCQ